MKTLILIITILFLFFSINSFSQVAINTTGVAPVASSMLDITSTTSGLLIPRMTLVQKNAIAAPATGLLVYQTDGQAGFWYYNGTAWVRFFGGNAWDILGNSGTAAATNFLGTTDAVDFVMRTNNVENMRITSSGLVGIGTNAPSHKLTIQSSTISTARLIGPGSFGSTARLNFGDNNYVYLDEDIDDNLTIYGSNRIALMGGNVGVGTTTPSEKLHITNNVRADGIVFWGNGLARTETRDDAGLRGDAGARSGFYETASPSNYPSGAGSWWHLIDTRHSNNGNNYALQIAGSFFDQKLYFRKTNNNPAQAWLEILTTANNGDFIQNQFAGAQTANHWVSGNSRATEVYSTSWFRNDNAGTGLYNQATGTGIFSPSGGVMSIYNNGSLGVGTTTPSSMLSVGASSQFQVNSSGNAVRINNVPYSWPATQGGVGSLLKNDGSGNLSWAGTNAQVISQVYTYNSTANICISGGWVDVTGCTATIPLIAGQKVVAWSNGAAMADNNCDGSSDAVYANYNVRIAYDGADFTNGAWMRSNVDNQGSYHVFDNWAIVGEQDIATTGNHTFNLQGSWSSGSGNCIIGGNSSSALQAIMVLIIYQ